MIGYDPNKSSKEMQLLEELQQYLEEARKLERPQALKEVPNYLSQSFSLMAPSVGLLSSLIGFFYAGYAIYDGDTKKIVGGLVLFTVSSFFGGFTLGSLRKRKQTPSSLDDRIK